MSVEPPRPVWTSAELHAWAHDLRATGHTLAAIAWNLRTSVATVRRWLAEPPPTPPGDEPIPC